MAVSYFLLPGIPYDIAPKFTCSKNTPKTSAPHKRELSKSSSSSKNNAIVAVSDNPVYDVVNPAIHRYNGGVIVTQPPGDVIIDH